MSTLLDELHVLCGAVGVAGLEQGAAETAAGLLRQYAPDAKVDVFGNVTGTIPGDCPDAPTLLLDAHIDEIGLIVTGIDDRGFLKVGNCGGVDRRLLAAQYVTVHTSKGPLTGLVGSKPPHLESAEEAKQVPELKNMFIDIGMTKEQAEASIALGDRITLESGLVELLGGRVSGKALDDRAGVASILEALRLVAEARAAGQKLPVNLAIQFSGREETGGQGAKISSFSLAPDWAVAVDVSFAAQPGAPAEKCGKLGKGPMIGYSPALDRNFSDAMKRLAIRDSIPYQVEVMGGTTGTNADDIGVSRCGVRAALLSIPQRNMHTPVEVVQLSDVADTARLMAAFIFSGSPAGVA